MAISNGGQCPQLNSGLGTSHGWLSSMWIERSDTLIHALGYNTTLFAGQSEGWYVLILVPKKLEDLETFNAVLQRGAGEEQAIIFFEDWEESVRKFVPSDRLLVFRVQDGWKPLADHLGVPVVRRRKK